MRPSSGSRSPQWAGHYDSKDITARAGKPSKVHSRAGCSESRGVRCSTAAQARRARRPRDVDTTPLRREARRAPRSAASRSRSVPRGSSVLVRTAAGRSRRSRNGHPAPRAGGRRLGALAVKNNGGSLRQMRKACRHETTRPSRNSGRPGPT